MGRPQIVIFMEGGLIQDMVSDLPVDVLVLDYDTDGEDRIVEINEWDFSNQCPSGKKDQVFDSLGAWSPGLNPLAVEHYFSEMERVETEKEKSANGEEKMP